MPSLTQRIKDLDGTIKSLEGTETALSVSVKNAENTIGLVIKGAYEKQQYRERVLNPSVAELKKVQTELTSLREKRDQLKEVKEEIDERKSSSQSFPQSSGDDKRPPSHNQ